MTSCDSDEERQLALGKPSNVSQCMSEEATSHRRQVRKSDIEPCPYAPSPIYRVPVDVLRSIFELYCQVELPVTFPLPFRPSRLIASHVCSAWRQIMLGNPIFWNKIEFLRLRLLEGEPYDLEVPRIWLSRAKDLPCFIDFFSYNFESYLMLPLSRPFRGLDLGNIVRDLIAPHKCKSLGVVFGDEQLHDLLQLSDEKLSYIEVLRLDYIHDGINRETQLNFHKLTNLTSFSLRTTILHRSGSILTTEDRFQIFSSLLWHQLRHIHLDVELPALCCLNILKTSSPVLETCSLVVWEDLSFVSLPPSKIKPVHCKQLREFKVCIYSSILLDSCVSFLLLLRLPKLKSLTLEYPNGDILDAPIYLQSFFRISTMRLEKLIISGLVCDVDARALLASMPSLRCLELPESSIFTVDVIRELGAGSIGPFLEELIINNSEIADEIGELIQMVKMRSSTVEKENSAPESNPTPFKHVLLYCKDHDGSLRQGYDATIVAINQFGVKLTVKFLDEDDDDDNS